MLRGGHVPAATCVVERGILAGCEVGVVDGVSSTGGRVAYGKQADGG